ncbi:hypothetical protein HYH02_015163 [Chlamydomonas schloesseri]|uniref:Uncharacterized protein n=1 Tax=Chlamydomonas schloesseri TaxID=2026947 RepID=A0A835SQ26_9CHLO|nr:hypothetical protein HYH02_015163 [Chlamydomonas schloesseri]|eukprot:KAG2424490.1 hypothetical protein HYH02_015163 [Chlamydomonas schloesseri]
MTAFLDAPVAAERGGAVPSGPVTYGGTVPQEDEAAEAAARAEREARFMADTNSKDYMQMLLNSPMRPGAGSATLPAASLAGVLAERPPGTAVDGDEGSEGGAISSDLRMEEFTAAKEARLRALGGEIITRDLTYNPGPNVAVRVSMPGAGMMAGPEAQAEAEAKAEEARRAAEAAAAVARAEEEARVRAAAEAAAAAAAAAAASGMLVEGDSATGEEDVYKPKVSTWGMFPRPKDISEAYGGGRNLKPGQELETPKQRAERERSYAAALAAYKAKAGLEVDPDDEDKAAKLYEEGMELFMDGKLKAAYDMFEKAVALVPVKTKYGGLATLQKAIVLDSVGNHEAAQKLYKSIANHAVAQVSKKAKQMLFSFEAMDFMKADKFSYAVKKEEYDKYFRGAADRRTLYVASEEERKQDEANARAASLVALAVILGPVLAIGALALQR